MNDPAPSVYLVGLVDQFRAALTAEGYDVSETTAMIDVGAITAAKDGDTVRIKFAVERGRGRRADRRY